MKNRPTVDQFAGCMIGQAVGDALGFVVEGLYPEICESYVDRWIRAGELPDRQRAVYALGQYSDDTQLARELAISLVGCAGFNPSDYAQRIAAMFTQEKIIGQGNATSQAAHRVAQGTAWNEAGTRAPNAGNGTAMRVAPVGLLFARHPRRLIHAARHQGRITHKDRRCSAGSIAIAGAVAYAARQGRIKAEPLCAQLADWTRPYDPVLADALSELPDWSREPPESAYEWIGEIGSEDIEGGWMGISPFVTPSVLWSLYSVVHSPDDYLESICTAIAVGGDVDTTAAMTGAIAGAALGLTGIPRDLAEIVTDQGTWEHDDLVNLAHDLYELHCQLPGSSA